MDATAVESSKTASLKSVLVVIALISNVLNNPAMSEIPLCIVLKVNLECIGSAFHVVCANRKVDKNNEAIMVAMFFMA
jgi:hypothetical protein